MLPVEIKVEPDEFHELVRVPGNLFLQKNPTPKTSDWKGKEYWRLMLPEAREKYNEICAYSACWIPYGTGNHTIDHFLSKRSHPDLAFE